MYSRRALPAAARGVRVRPRLERGAARCGWPPRPSAWRSCAARRLGEDVRPAARADLRRSEAQELLPADGRPTACSAPSYLPTDGYLDPSQLTYALADGARRGGARIFTHTRVTGIDVERGRVRGVRTERGDIEAEVVVNAGGMFARRDRAPGRRARADRADGARVPRHPAVPRPRARSSTCRRCATPTCSSTSARRAAGLVMGGYERHPRAVVAAATTASTHIPPDFNGRLLEEDWDRFEEIVAQLAPARAGDGGRQGHAADQRAGGLHARRRVLPRRDRGARLLRRRRLLRPRARRRRRHRQGDGRVDRRRRAEPRPLAHGHPPLRRALPLAALHAQAHARGLRDLLRHPLPRPRAPGRAAAARLARLRVAPRARRGRSARSPAGSA